MINVVVAVMQFVLLVHSDFFAITLSLSLTVYDKIHSHVQDRDMDIQAESESPANANPHTNSLTNPDIEPDSQEIS